MANFIPEQEKYKNLTPFKLAVLQNFPYIEEDFDALTNYGLMCKIVEYLNNVISNENAVESNVSALYNSFVALQNYVNNYFDNLNVQNEINKKLDEMASDGTLINLISTYLTPFVEQQNARIDLINSKVESAVSGSPAGVYNTIAELQQADPDHSKIYIVAQDGEWYFYNTSTNQWKNGGVYQASEDSNTIERIQEIINLIFTKYLIKDESINKYNKNDLVSGFIDPWTGELRTSITYKTTDYIDMNGHSYICSSVDGVATNMRFVAQYNKNKELIPIHETEGVNVKTPYVMVDSNCRYVRVTPLVESLNANLMLELTNSVQYNDYQPYYNTEYTINEQCISDSEIVVNKKIMSNGYYLEHTTPQVNPLNLISPYEFNDVCDYIIKFSTQLSTNAESIEVGIGDTDDYGAKVVIDQTHITCGSRSVEHGLRLVLGATLIINVGRNHTADIELISSYNNESTYPNYSYKWNNVPWDARKGQLYAKVTGTNVSYSKLSFINKNYDKENWLIGDSYFNTIAENRWTSYLYTNGHDENFMLNGFPGRESQDALSSFESLLNIRIPKRVIWCMGMNDPDTSNSIINTNYKDAVDRMIELSQIHGFELMLSTIPNTPSRLHVAKNQFVRNSGLKYVDFSTAVGANGAGATWTSNCLSSDGVHPTNKGAMLLYGRAMSDIPELY